MDGNRYQICAQTCVDGIEKIGALNYTADNLLYDGMEIACCSIQLWHDTRVN